MSGTQLRVANVLPNTCRRTLPRVHSSSTSECTLITPGQRVDLIRECATLLDGREWEEIDLILRSFNIPVMDDLMATSAAM